MSSELSNCDESASLCKSVDKTQIPQQSKSKSKQSKRKSQNAIPNDSPVKNGCSKANDEKENEDTPTKINAFQFMMNSRHKSIGRNSPGRELDFNDSLDSALHKKELNERKKLLESWAEQKSAKRRRDYEGIGNMIELKLEKRKRRLKKMLDVEYQSDDEFITKRKKRAVAKIDSESDSEHDGVNETTQKEENSFTSKKEKTKKSTPKVRRSSKFKLKCSLNENEYKEIDVEESSSDNKIIEVNNEVEKIDDTEGRRVLRTRKPKMYDDFVFFDDDLFEETRTKKKVKMAPVFLKAVPKPKIDPQEVEAKRQFLMSGIPSSLKKEMEKQQGNQEVDFDVFPLLSHVQQKSPENSFWNLPKVELSWRSEECEKIEMIDFSDVLLDKEQPNEVQFEDIKQNKIQNYKKIIKEIKSQHPNYPVYKVFNSLWNKNYRLIENPDDKKDQKVTIKRRGRPKKSLEKNSPPKKTLIKNEETVYAMWTEKYKPKSSSDIIGNYNSVSSLKEWLTNWLKDPNNKKKRNDSDSDFDIDNSNSNSRESTKSFGNTVLLKGPTGCGKTAAVYAVCNELGLSVLEVNASTKRSGKRLLQELQEATQSHQVCKTDNVFTLMKEKQVKSSNLKICVLLVEDVDIVFEQDDGFSAALSQIITTSKRPIILTTTDEPSSSVQKVINDCKIIKFSKLTSILSIWLQIVCLIEGLYLDTKSLVDILNYNRGDIRRTLLQLQLYVNSGGQRKKMEKKNETIQVFDGELLMDDDSNLSDSKLEDLNESKDCIRINYDCLDSCQLIKNYKLFSLPLCNNLEVIWWNWASILSLPNFSNRRLDYSSKRSNSDEGNKTDKKQLKLLSECYDSLAVSDIFSNQNVFHESLERKWRRKTKDNLVLDESMASYKDEEISNELIKTLLSGRINIYKERYSNQSIELNMSVPNIEEDRWRSKQYSCEDTFQNAIQSYSLLDRKALALDYMPCLRSIARFEQIRATNNAKRGNRFYNYLRSLGVHTSEATYKSACNVFPIWD